MAEMFAPAAEQLASELNLDLHVFYQSGANVIDVGMHLNHYTDCREGNPYPTWKSWTETLPMVLSERRWDLVIVLDFYLKQSICFTMEPSGHGHVYRPKFDQESPLSTEDARVWLKAFNSFAQNVANHTNNLVYISQTPVFQNPTVPECIGRYNMQDNISICDRSTHKPAGWPQVRLGYVYSFQYEC